MLKNLSQKLSQFFPGGEAPKRERGMTLIEIIIVVSILATLLGILVRNLNDQADKAREDQCRIAMGTIAQSLQLFRVNNNRYPTTAEGLIALVTDPGSTKRWRGPYIEKSKLNDPWGKPYDYQSDGRKFKIISGGLDETVGTADDIVYPPAEDGDGPSGGGGGGSDDAQ